jgi:hypothetical protein
MPTCRGCERRSRRLASGGPYQCGNGGARGLCGRRCLAAGGNGDWSDTGSMAARRAGFDQPDCISHAHHHSGDRRQRCRVGHGSGLAQMGNRDAVGRWRGQVRGRTAEPGKIAAGRGPPGRKSAKRATRSSSPAFPRWELRASQSIPNETAASPRPRAAPPTPAPPAFPSGNGPRLPWRARWSPCSAPAAA